MIKTVTLYVVNQSNMKNVLEFTLKPIDYVQVNYDHIKIESQDIIQDFNIMLDINKIRKTLTIDKSLYIWYLVSPKDFNKFKKFTPFRGNSIEHID